MENLITTAEACDIAKIERRTLLYRVKKVGLKPEYTKMGKDYYDREALLLVAERKSPNGLISVMEMAKRNGIDKNSLRIRIDIAELQHVDTGYNRAFLYHEADLVKLLEEMPVLKYPKGTKREKKVEVFDTKSCMDFLRRKL